MKSANRIAALDTELAIQVRAIWREWLDAEAALGMNGIHCERTSRDQVEAEPAVQPTAAGLAGHCGDHPTSGIENVQ